MYSFETPVSCLLSYNSETHRFDNCSLEDLKIVVESKDACQKIALSIFAAYDFSETLKRYSGFDLDQIHKRGYRVPKERDEAGEVFQLLSKDYVILGAIAESRDRFSSIFELLSKFPRIDLLFIVSHGCIDGLGLNGRRELLVCEDFSDKIMSKLDAKALIVTQGCLAGYPEGLAQRVSRRSQGRIVIACDGLCGDTSYRKPKSQDLSFPFAFETVSGQAGYIGANYFKDGECIASVKSPRIFIQSKL